VKDTTRQPTTMPGSEPPPAEVLELPDRCSGRRISSCGSGAQGGSMRSLARATCWPMSSRLGSASSSNGGTRGLRTRSDPEECGVDSFPRRLRVRRARPRTQSPAR